ESTAVEHTKTVSHAPVQDVLQRLPLRRPWQHSITRPPWRGNPGGGRQSVVDSGRDPGVGAIDTMLGLLKRTTAAPDQPWSNPDVVLERTQELQATVLVKAYQQAVPLRPLPTTYL